MRIRSVLRVGLALVTLIGASTGALCGRAFAASAPPVVVPPGLSFAEIKMTGDEFLVLTNNSQSAIPDLSIYWLYNYNKSNPQTAGATTTTQQLPATPLGPGASLLLSDGGATCGAQAAAALSISLTDSGGTLQLLASTSAGLILPTSVDQVSWSSSTNGDIQNVPTSSKDKQAAYYRTANGSGFGWTFADVDLTTTGFINICQLDVPAGGGPVQTIDPNNNQLLPPGEAPATIVSLAATSGGAAAPHLPASDVGLAAPQITELLPNPAGTGTDGTDEFIELYNSNGATFDLSGFTLETGATTKHTYTFPAGVTLPAKGFKVFYSAETGLSLSNSSGAADLLDPLGNLISQTDTYGSAKDGLTWALAKGAWYWTSKPTPNAANVIVQAASIKTTSAKKATAAVKGASTTATALRGGGQSSLSTAQDGGSALIHPYVLAAIAVLAVGYGVYEYRHDLGNKFHQLRANRAARRAARR